MLTRMLCLHALVFALVATSVLAEHPRVVCNNITPTNPVGYSQVTGGWVGIETVQFKDGQAFAPEDDVTPHACLHGTTSDATENGFKVSIEIQIPDRDVVKEDITLTSHGQANVTKNDYEFLLLAADKDRYLVYLVCMPPNEAGERLPLRVNLLARHDSQADHSALSAEELQALEARIGEKLGIAGHGVKPVKLCSSCWASYTEDA
ncbi:hypothetical protein B566_EDAN003046 [Ephemera danica]|nr:hypothetical protein B566_EDAN003046 [Ephemera danica]